MTPCVFWTCFLTLVYVYIGYPLVIRILAELMGEEEAGSTLDPLPLASVIVCVYNEEKWIARRIENILELDYPKDRLEIIVGSDGSTDRTVEIARQYKDRGVTVAAQKSHRGRACMHNEAVEAARGEFIVLTDAETLFDKNFLQETMKFFPDERIGCVSGSLTYRTRDTSISQSEGLYWSIERRLLAGESRLGLLANATGACMTFRKRLWKPLAPADDADFSTPLDVILQGYRVAHALRARATDVPPATVEGELQARMRQTSTALMGTLRHWGLRGFLKYPGVSWNLVSHKILRWFGLYFMIGAWVANGLLISEGTFYQSAFVAQTGFYFAALLGFLGDLLGKRLPVASGLYSFCLANVGMGLGVVLGLGGKAPAAYKMPE